MLKLTWRPFNLGWLDILHDIRDCGSSQSLRSCSTCNFTCLSLATRLSWWLIIALCSRHEAGPSSSRDRRLDLISCFCIKWAISCCRDNTTTSHLKKVEVIYGVLNSAELTFVPHPVPLVLLWSLPLGKNYMWKAGSSVNKKTPQNKQ